MSCSGFFFFKQKTAYEMRISDWSSDVCSSDLPGRGERLTAEGAGWYLDYAKQRVEPETMRLLLELAEACGVTARRDAMFAGAHVNATEDRAALHVALRAPADAVFEVDGANVVPEVHAVLARMGDFSTQVREGRWLDRKSTRLNSST